MTDDPVRLREGGSPFLRKALASARSETPDEARSASLESRILPLLLPPLPPVPPPPPGVSAAAKAGAAALSAKAGLSLVKGSVLAIAAAALLAGAGAGALYVVQSDNAKPVSSGVVPSASVLSSPSAMQGATATASVAPSLELVPIPPSRPSATGVKPPSAVPSASAHDVADPDLEAPLLRAAQDALRSNPGEALAKTQEHTRKYPRGLLVQEREVIAIEALMKLGRRDEAVARADRFSKSFPGSTHQRRIETLVGEKK